MAQDERVVKFVSAITAEAEEQRAAIQLETKNFVDSEMKKAESDALNESFQMIQRAAGNIRADAGSRISAGKSERRRALLMRREEIVAEVLDAVREKLEAYTRSRDYADFLKSSAEQGKTLFGSAYNIHIRPADMRYASLIAPDGCTVIADESIRIGGLKFSDMSGFKTADDTLDTRLHSGRDWFMKNSGLRLGAR